MPQSLFLFLRIVQSIFEKGERVEMVEVNVEEIMKEIRQEIMEKGYTDDMLSFQDVVETGAENVTDHFDKVLFNEEVYTLNTRWNVQKYHDIAMQSGIKGKIIKFFKKIIRKCTHFYIDAIVDEQNMFNAAVVRSFNLMNQYISEKEMEKSVNVLKEKNKGEDELKQKIANLEQEIACLKAIIEKNGDN